MENGLHSVVLSSPEDIERSPLFFFFLFSGMLSDIAITVISFCCVSLI